MLLILRQHRCAILQHIEVLRQIVGAQQAGHSGLGRASQRSCKVS